MGNSSIWTITDMEYKQGIGKVTGVAKAPESSKPRKKGVTGCQFLGGLKNQKVMAIRASSRTSVWEKSVRVVTETLD